MRRAVVAVVVMLMVCGQCPASDWSVVDASWRPDENPWAKQQVWDNWMWAEGWGEKEQFWPKYTIPAGSIHIIARNNSNQPAVLEFADLDGQPWSVVSSGPTRAGRVVWRHQFPRQTQPGQWAECILRLRNKPAKDVRVGFTSGGERFEITVPAKPNRVRMESMSFSPRIDRLYVYVRSLDGGMPKPGKVRLDLGAPGSYKWWPGPKESALALAEVPLKSAWELGSYHLVEVFLQDGSSLAYPVRAWDNYYMIGLFGTCETARVREASERGINTYIHPRDTAMMDSFNLNYVPGWIAGKGRDRIPGKQSGNLFYYNKDEPDAHDTEFDDVPYMDRLGLFAQPEVLPRYWEQYDADPRTPALLLVNNTYKPLNYYVYGQCVDIYCSDPYVPLGGDQCEYIAHALECARDASAPCPTMACLWCTSMGENQGAKFRPPTPEEERLMVFYALGAGVKGVMYFADRDTQTGEYLSGVFHNKLLWNEMGRINADIAALAPYLAVGCPAGPMMHNDKVWYRSIMCGSDKMVVIVVNKGHHIGYNTQQGFAWHFPAKDVRVTVPLTSRLAKCRIQEVRNGRLVAFGPEVKGGEVALKMDTVDTARAFVITAIQ